MKDFDKSKELSFLNQWDVNNLFGWAVSVKLPVNNFEWIEETSQFKEDFIKNYTEEIYEGYFLKVDTPSLKKKIFELDNDLPFYQKERNFKTSKSL